MSMGSKPAFSANVKRDYFNCVCECFYCELFASTDFNCECT